MKFLDIKGRPAEVLCSASVATMFNIAPLDGAPPGLFILMRTHDGRTYGWALDPAAIQR